MKLFSVLLTLSASLFWAGHLNAQAFRNPDRLATTQDSISVFTVDVNGDGLTDLVYETVDNSTTSSSMNFMFGRSSGGFVAGPTLTLPNRVGGCRLTDANRDGKLDLICLHSIDEFDIEAATLLGNGDATFQAPIYSAPMQSSPFASFGGWLFTPADLNGDGIEDLLVGDVLDQWIFVLLGDGTGRFTVKTILGGAPISQYSGFTADSEMSITVGDLNGDGKPDLAFSDGPTVLLGNGDGSFQPPNTYTHPYFSCVYHDMDGDGRLDAVCATVFAGNELAILHGNADGSFNTTPIFTETYNIGDLPWPVNILDLNGDGILDILADSSDGLEVVLGEPGLKFAAPVHYAVGYPANNGDQSSQLIDINQDGHMDVVASGPNGIYISYGSGDGTFNTAPAHEVAQVVGRVTVADFNGDGILDIAATGDQNIELSVGNGDGTFEPYVALPNGGIDFSMGGTEGGAQIVHGDFRGSGKQDILAIGSPSVPTYNSYILFGNGDGSFASPQAVPNSSVLFPAYDIMKVLDINKDGRDDLLTTDGSHIYSALSNGDGTFTTVTTASPTNPSGMNPSFPAFADFNHDGNLDAAYGTSSSVQVLKGHGDGAFDTTGVNLPIPAYLGQSPLTTSTAQVTAGDFDGDGNLDIAALVEYIPQIAPWTNQILTAAYVYYGRGDGSFSSPVPAGAFNREYTGIFTTDVNKDGLSDLILQTYGATGFLDDIRGDTLGVLLSQTGRVFGPEVNYTGGQIESGLVIADLNGDGYPDLLAVNSGYFPNGDYLTFPPNTVTELLNLGTQPSLIPSTTVLTSSSNPATAGASVTFTATVSSSTSGEGAPTGSVVFADQTGFRTSVPLVAISSSAASAAFTTSSIASDVVSAIYSGDTVFAASSASISQMVTGDPVTITFTAAPNPVVAGQTVALNVTVGNPPGSSLTIPTGTVTLSDGSSTLAGPITLTSGAAAYNATFSVAGMHALAASYSGDALHVPTSATLNEQVQSSLPGSGDSSEWAWMGGSSTVDTNCNQYGNCGPVGVYGTLGTPAAANIPGGRFGAFTWTGNNGSLWLFAGDGFDGNGTLGELNDLWEFNPATNQWTWTGGSSTIDNSCTFVEYCGRSGVYGTLHTPAAGNNPGGRSDGARWTDSNGHLSLFGGYGIDSNGDLGYLNDLWDFNSSTNQWTWMSGSSRTSQSGVYGTLGTPAAGNSPGGRSSAVSWVDSNGHLWLFGGLGMDANGTLGYLNDVWEFDPSTELWSWMGGSRTIGSVCGAPSNCGQPGVYGTLGTSAAGNIPGGRQLATAWTDSSGHTWLFGGFGFDSKGGWSALNDLWEFNSSANQWTWVGGSSAIASDGAGQPTVYGTLGTPAVGNNPGGHYDSASWIDSRGHLWFFGGVFISTLGGTTVNDQWEFNPSTNEWTWWGGSSSGNEIGVYGTLGIPAPGNFPGPREDAMAWTGSSGNAWLFGGGGYDANDRPGFLNDLWTYQPAPTLPAAATPKFSMPAGSYSTAQSVAISDTIPGAVIYYTTDGTTPTISSRVYSAPITVSSSEMIKAIATATGYATSAVATAAYAITTPAAMPTFSVPAGSYSTAQSVTISDTTSGAVIYYTTNDATPTTSSNVYSAPIAVSTSETLKAIATATGYSASPVASAVYTIATPVATPTFSVPAGSYFTAQSVTISDATSGSVIYYTTDGATPTTSSSIYGTPVIVANSETLKAIATATGYTTSAVASATYTVVSPTTTTLTASSSTLSYGQTLTLTAKVTPASGATPTGAVTFYNGAASLGKMGLNGSGVAALALTPSVGGYSITASYGGSANDAPSASTPVSISVIASATATGLTASPNPAPFGSIVTFTATVGSATAIPVGSASFYDGSVLLTTKTLASGVASYSTSALDIGSHNIAAVYEGGTGFNISTSNTVVEVISPADFSISASPGVQAVYTGEAASYRVTITSGVGFNLPVALSCAHLPANTTCAFSSATISGGTGSTTLTVQTKAPGKAATASALTSKVGTPLLVGFLLLFIPRRFRHSRNNWLTFLALFLSIALGAAITGCSAPVSLTGGTPVGAQTLTVTGVATNGSQTLTRMTTVTLNVKSLF